MLKRTLSIAMILVALSFVTQGFGQDKKEEGIRMVTNAKETETTKQVNLAMNLVDYGYSNKSALALVQAAEILSNYGVGTLELKDDNGKAIEAEKPLYSYEPSKLLADAKTFANKDTELLKYINKQELVLNTQTRGPKDKNIVALTTTIVLDAGQAKTIAFDVESLSAYRLNAISSNYSSLYMSAWTALADKGSDSGTNPVLWFVTGICSRVFVEVENLSGSSTTAQITIIGASGDDFDD